MSLNRESLSNQIYKQLREDIILGRIPSGKHITMRELQDRFNISSTPVREALVRLSQDRFVEYTTHQGVKVLELNDKDVRDLLDIRCLCDCYAIEKTMLLSDREELLAQLHAAIEQQKNYLMLPNESYSEYSLIFSNFHDVIYRRAGNDWITELAQQYNSLLFLADVRKKINYPQEAIDEHTAILEAIAADDLAEALQKMREHCKNEWQRYIETP